MATTSFIHLIPLSQIPVQYLTRVLLRDPQDREWISRGFKLITNDEGKLLIINVRTKQCWVRVRT